MLWENFLELDPEDARGGFEDNQTIKISHRRPELEKQVHINNSASSNNQISSFPGFWVHNPISKELKTDREGEWYPANTNRESKEGGPIICSGYILCLYGYMKMQRKQKKGEDRWRVTYIASLLLMMAVFGGLSYCLWGCLRWNFGFDGY